MFPLEILNNSPAPGFRFQQYYFGSAVVSPYEALADLKYPDGTFLPNDAFFDPLRDMDEAHQLEVDRFLVPRAIKAAQIKGYLPVAVNVHLASLIDPGFIGEVETLIEQYGLSKSDVMFEIVEPHAPNAAQLVRLKKISVRSNPENGFVLIIDDHNFETGHERIYGLAPYCDMVKIDLDQASLGVAFLKANYPHLSIVLERVAVEDRQDVLDRHPGVAVQGL